MPVIAGLAAVDLIFIALMGALLLFATRQLWEPMLLWGFSQIPVVGNWIAGHVADLINVAIRKSVEAAQHAIAPLVHAIQRTDSRIRGYTAAVSSALQAGADTLHWLRYVFVPAVETRLIAFTQALGQRLSAQAVALYQAATLYARQLADQVLTTAQNLYQSALAISRALQLDAVTQALQAVGALAASVGATIAGERAITQQAIDQARVRAAADTAAVGHAAGTAVTQAEQYARDLVAGANGFARTLALETERDVARSFAQSTAYARALAIPLTAAVTAIEDSPCIRMCNPLGQLGAELQALDLGILLAILVGAATHPKEGAAALTDMLAPGSQAAHGELRSLFGAP